MEKARRRSEKRREEDRGHSNRDKKTEDTPGSKNRTSRTTRSTARSSTDKPMEVDDERRRHRKMEDRKKERYRPRIADSSDDDKGAKGVENLSDQLEKLQLDLATARNRGDYLTDENKTLRWKMMTLGTLHRDAEKPASYLKLAKGAVKVTTSQLEDTWLMADEPARSKRRS